MFKRRLSRKNMVGLDIGSSAIKAIELRGQLGSLHLSSISYETLQADSITDGQIMELNDVSNCIANIFTSQQIKTDQVAAGVSGNSVIVKNIIVPQMSEAELEESIDWHAEEHIPFDIADVS
ncbi:MAG: pilus assembly protein PilM, partial [Pyrinomonadaceae bacterium]|nr:pilus assembly protein PilM [Pyrinomonadaceae bacterium]